MKYVKYGQGRWIPVMENYEANDAVLVIDGHAVYGFGSDKTYTSDEVQKANDDFLKWLYKKQQAIFAKKIAKFAHLAGDGKDKYVRALVIGFDDIDVDVDVTEIPQEQYGGSKKFTDDEFKQLLDDCNVKHR